MDAEIAFQPDSQGKAAGLALRQAGDPKARRVA
jgi:hypothetical protein